MGYQPNQQRQQYGPTQQGRGADVRHVASYPPARAPRTTITSPLQPGEEALARWLTQTTYPTDSDRLSAVFQIADTAPFAQLWYAARDAGELLRAKSLRALYTQRAAPGGAHPDPRQAGAAFSSQAVLSTAARLLGASIWQVPEYLAAKTDILAQSRRPTLAWLATYPTGRPPDIAVRVTTRHRLQEFDVACLLGYLAREHARLFDPETPAGMILLPSDPGMTTVLHQFAIGLLALPQDCPADWRCPCNSLRLRYNAPPPDHQQATDAFSASDLAREMRRQTRRLDHESQRLVRETQDALDAAEASDPHRTMPGGPQDSGPQDSGPQDSGPSRDDIGSRH